MNNCTSKRVCSFAFFIITASGRFEVSYFLPERSLTLFLSEAFIISSYISNEIHSINNNSNFASIY